MKLQELAAPKPSQQIGRVFESYFGSRIDFDKMSPTQTSKMLSRVRGLIKEHQSTVHRHTSEKNPSYLKLVMMEQALSSHLKEMTPPVPAPAPGATTTQIDPKLKAAKDKLKSGQVLSPDEQKLINSVAAMTTENRLRRAYQFLKESEVQQAQVVLAAQDMVDKMQSMLEDTSEMQFKELPALVDSIRNQIGMEQATQFNTDVTGALQGLVQNLQGAKGQLEQALGVVTGQAPAAAIPGADMGAELGAELGAEAGADMGAEAGADMGAVPDDEMEPAEEPAALGTKGALGRARR